MLTPSAKASVKHMVQLNVRVQERRAQACQVQLVQDQVFECLLQLGLADEHRADHAPAQQQHAHEAGVIALRSALTITMKRI